MLVRLVPALLFHLGVLSTSIFWAGCSSHEASRSPDADASSGQDQAAEAGAEAGTAHQEPEYDDQGVPVPDRSRQALGVAIPLGFKLLRSEQGESVYRGPIAPEKMFAFYQKYLVCSQVVQGRRGWQFKGATPRAPGDESRLVDLTLLKAGRRHSQVVIFDRMGRREVTIPDSGLKTYEELREAAHKGEGSLRRPLPGTY